ncbi:MAG: hypothetical protein JWM11_7732 [Planctomycetaceae bacterium]|nr:hypothetical protein [Planctomycetaceae bacterium]
MTLRASVGRTFLSVLRSVLPNDLPEGTGIGIPVLVVDLFRTLVNGTERATDRNVRPTDGRWILLSVLRSVMPNDLPKGRRIGIPVLFVELFRTLVNGTERVTDRNVRPTIHPC